MTDTNKLREALLLLRNHTSINSHQIEIIDEAIAAIKPEPLPSGCAAVQSGPCVAAACVCKPEPQARAGEPEVVASVAEWPDDLQRTGLVYEVPREELPAGTQLITLQSHREALQDQTIGYEKTIDKLNDAIAKKDAAFQALAEQGATAEKQALEVINRLHGEAAEMRAALKACVEALEGLLEGAEAMGWDTSTSQSRAAITQAQEAMK